MGQPGNEGVVPSRDPKMRCVNTRSRPPAVKKKHAIGKIEFQGLVTGLPFLGGRNRRIIKPRDTGIIAVFIKNLTILKLHPIGTPKYKRQALTHSDQLGYQPARLCLESPVTTFPVSQ